MSGRSGSHNGLSRRSVLLGGLALPVLASGFAASPGRAGESAPALLLVITGIDPATSPALLTSVTEPFVRAGLAVVLSVNPFLANGTAMSPLDAISRSLRDALDKFPAQLELAVDVRDLPALSPYGQLRQASNSQAALTKAINAMGDCYVQPVVMASTLTTRTLVGSLEDLSGLRAAGIRTVIHLPQTANETVPASRGYWKTSSGLAKTFAGTLTSSPRSPAKIAAAIQFESRSPEPIVVTFSLSDLGSSRSADIASYATQLARHLASLWAAQTVYSILPYELYKLSMPGPARYVIVRVDDFRLSNATDSNHKLVVAELLSRGIPISQAVIPGGVVPLANDDLSKNYLRKLSENPIYDFATHGQAHLPNELLGQTDDFNREVIGYGITSLQDVSGREPLTYIPPNNVYDAATLRAYQQYGGKVFSSEHGNFNWFWGLDEFGILHASHTIGPEKSWGNDIAYHEPADIARFIGSRNDAVLMLHPQTMNSASKFRAVFDTLDLLSQERKTQLTNFRQYYDKVMPVIPALERVQTARYEVGVNDRLEGESSLPSHDELVKAAAVAWQYFDRWQKKYKGLAPATGWLEGNQIKGYPFATMWDVASMIMATISAQRLGFISQQRFEEAITSILRFVRTARYKRRSSFLPATEHPLKGTGGARGGFDSADTGRLLIALKVLDQVTNQEFRISKIVNSWDLGASIIEGRMHDLLGRKATSVHKSSYAQYAAQGYRLWGYPVLPIYTEANPLANMDATLRFIEELQEYGRIATEPITTEQIEVGSTDHGTLAADLLLAAQIARHKETGILTCASEGPADRAPWFTYQGYQLKPDGGSWEVDLPPDSESLGEKRKQSFRTISTKGCFLWLAARPGQYSRKLYDTARTVGLTNGIGFASGIYESSFKATDHTDVNTNGIILEAILYILSGSKPAIKLQPK
ncbi:MAG: DUF3131 domain-containing protein [Aestuariivirga sp.]|nr:DUF3131 domain-containing protein [Aestuariivirga sp.]